jgi:hypothetical protein
MAEKPKCFIAMAFDHDDTDALYDDQILPILVRNNIQPIIINRQQSNLDLNIQIIQELLGCDFCITDLTYARPSVYYETGFAERLVPVIYTVRSDHLGRSQPDDQRVHFDLQMKPLIIWKNASDEKFSNELEKRIKATFLVDWNRKQKDLLEINESEEGFLALSQLEKQALLRQKTISVLNKLGFRNWNAPKHPNRTYTYEEILLGRVNDVNSTKTKKKALSIVIVNAFTSSTKSTLKKLQERYETWRFPEIFGYEVIGNASSIHVNHIVLSVRSIPRSRIEDVFSHHRLTSTPFVYSYDQQYRSWGSNQKNKHIPLTSTWHFLGGIDSEYKLKNVLHEKVDTYVRNMQI